MARASSLVNVMRMVFSAIGVAVLTTYFRQQATSYAAEAMREFQPTPSSGIAANCAATAGTQANALQVCVTQHTMIMGLNDTFWLVTIGCILCVLLALALGRDPAVEAARQAREKGEETTAPEMAIAE